MCCIMLQVLINSVTLGVSLAVALLTPGGAEKVYAIVGATGVLLLPLLRPVAAARKQTTQWLTSRPCSQ